MISLSTVKAINLLNQLLEVDPVLVSTVLGVNFSCNPDTATTDVEVFAVHDACMTNFLGLLNGMLDDKVACVYDERGNITGFTARHK